MNYSKEAIEKRNFRMNLIKKIVKKFLFIALIVGIYNTFLITKSALDDAASKEVFGYKAYIITTESMRPSIKIGDAIIVEKCSEEKLRIDDIITLRNAEGTAITHRIVEIEQNEYVTKGDNNNVEDPDHITYDQIEGRKVLVIPFFGKILLSLENKVYILILVIVIFIIVFNAINSQRKKKIRREKKKNEDQKPKEEQNSEKTS